MIMMVLSTLKGYRKGAENEDAHKKWNHTEQTSPEPCPLVSVFMQVLVAIP